LTDSFASKTRWFSAVVPGWKEKDIECPHFWLGILWCTQDSTGQLDKDNRLPALHRWHAKMMDLCVFEFMRVLYRS
jgi:hypothetical protein